MPRFTKERGECATYRDMLFQVFRDGKQWEDIPDEFKRDKRICAVMDACEVAGFDADKKLKFDLEMLNEFDRENQLRQEREKGLSQGRAEGLQQGYDINMVSSVTGLSVEVISALMQ